MKKVEIGRKNMSWIDLHVTSSKREVRNFGFLFCGLCILAAIYSGYRGSERWMWLLTGALFFLVSGLFIQQVLRPIFIGWMKFALILGWLNTRLVLGVIFYLVVTPVGLILRMLGKDPLDRKMDRSTGSYWKVRERKPLDVERYERLF